MIKISKEIAEELNLPMSVNLAYLNKTDAKKLNLPSKYGEIREDGYVFTSYYIRNSIIQEQWLSPKSLANQAKRKSINKKEHTKRTKKFIKRVKLYLGCYICGYKKSSDALHFDHLDITNKVREISRMSSCSFKVLKNEMRKCRVLCANCHAEHTEKQRNEGLFDNEINT
jgi:hypothetical protein|tara:strand:+ start:395 stop:904 length:510 start_codon:yes stop_codon:yes gene_type:complete